MGDEIDRDKLLLKLVDIHYERNDYELARAKFRARGDVIEVWPAYEEFAFRIELWGDEVENLSIINPLTGEEAKEAKRNLHLPSKTFRHADGQNRIRRSVDRSRTARAAGTLQEGRQAAGSSAAAGSHALRHRAASGNRLLSGHRELFSRAG